jgi:hypothetical protein
MRMKRFWGSALNLFMMVPFHLKNMMFFPMTRNSFAVWKTLRRVNHANETAYRERLDNHNDDGGSWDFYSVSGGGIVADRTIVVPLNENLD